MCFSLRAAGKAGGAKSAGRAVPPWAQASGSPPRTFGRSLGEAGRCLRRGRNQTPEQTPRLCWRPREAGLQTAEPSTWPPAPGQPSSPRGDKGRAHLGPACAGVHENQAGAPHPNPEGGHRGRHRGELHQKCEGNQRHTGSWVGLGKKAAGNTRPRRRVSWRRKAFTGPGVGAIPLRSALRSSLDLVQPGACSSLIPYPTPPRQGKLSPAAILQGRQAEGS